MSDPTTLLFRDFLDAQERTALTPVEILRMADMEPDPWQTEVLGYDGDRLLLNCSRQSGKSTVAAARAVGMLTAKPGSQVLMTAPSQRQSGELFRAASKPGCGVGHGDEPGGVEQVDDRVAGRRPHHGGTGL